MLEQEQILKSLLDGERRHPWNCQRNGFIWITGVDKGAGGGGGAWPLLIGELKKK